MSGIGEAIAIVSCIAGLIQAYDAAARRIDKVKKRRALRNKPPPPHHLETSVERGKQQIEAVVQEGKERFGEDFERGDVEVRMALMEITIETQNRMLEALADADENSSNFWSCIEASDTGRRRALDVLNNYMERKTKEERERDTAQSSLEPEIPASHMRDTRTQQAGRPVQGTQRAATSPLTQQVFSPPVQDAPRPARSAPGRSATMFAEPRPAQARRPAPVPVQSGETSLNTMRKRTASESTQATSGRTSPSQRQSTSTINTSLSNVSSSGSSAKRASISESTVGSVSITSYGGCCKYAHYLRDGKANKSLQRQILPFTHFTQGGEKINFICQSVKCKFQIPAQQDRRQDWVIDTRPITWRDQLQYTSIFLTKSHIPTQETKYIKAPYRCIMCVFSHEEAGTFIGVDALLEHVLDHSGASWNNMRLEGPLSFSNEGISKNGDFDIYLPVTIQRHWSSDVNPASDNEEELQHEIEELDIDSKISWFGS